MTEHPFDRRTFLKTSGITLTGTTVLTESTVAQDSSGGDLIWEFRTDRVRSSPTVVDGTVFIGSGGIFVGESNNVYALDVGDGSEQWRFETGSGVESSPTVVDGTVFVGSYDDNVYAIDAGDGTEQWRFGTGGLVESSPTVVDGTVFVGSTDDNVYALDADTGDEQWRLKTGAEVRSSPTVVDGTVFVGSEDSNVYALDAGDGSEQWRFETGFLLDSSPTVVDNTVFVGSQDGNMYALDPGDGSEQWRFGTGGPVYSSPTVLDSTVFVGSQDGNMYALNADDGSEQWRFGLGGLVESSPTVVDDLVFVGSYDENVYALDAGDGSEQWRFETGAEVSSSPTVLDGTVFVGSEDGNVYALDAGVEGSSEDSRVLLGTLGHTDTFAEQGPTEPGVPENPDAKFTIAPEDPSINQPITFDASASEASGGIEEYRWDFTVEGDTDATGEVVEIVFDEQNEYQVTLTVVDSDGREAETTQTVEVGINDFEAAVKSKRRVAEDIDDVALYLSELEDVNSVLSGLRESLYGGELDTDITEGATTRLRLGEEISRNLLINTSDESAIEGAEDENIAVDTTRFSIDLGVSLALSQLALVDVVADSRFGYLIPNSDILRKKLEFGIEELVSYTFSQALQSEALSEINSIVQEGYNRIIDDEFDNFENFFAFISDSVSATVANLTIMQTIETGGGFVPRSGPEFALIDAFANVESSLGYLNNELKAESLVDEGLDGTREGVVDAHDDAEELLNQIASTTDTFLSELNERIDIPGILKDAFDLIDGILNGDPISTVDAVTLVSVGLLPNASLATTVVQKIGKHVGEFSIRLMMTTHAWGIAGIQRGDPISLADINTLVPDVDSVLEDLDPTESRWGDFA
ncbi:PQQ-binding-like beta-propeller repeat protein [Halobacteriaceae archaeon SHR40]|uniref:outer membrane protein assembly factor BamB family protein n=1 Tax=Halovenus amylolytica TaxID=2500550 RepID=UPI0012602E32